MRCPSLPFLTVLAVLCLAAGRGSAEDGSASRPLKRENAPSPFGNSVVWQSIATVDDVQPGIGSAHRDDVVRAMDLVKQGKLDEAERLLEILLKAFAVEIESAGKQPVSFANRKEYETFQAEHPAEDVAWFDYAYGQTLHLRFR